MTPEFLLTALIVVVMPGTGVLYTIAIGLTQGRTASIFAALGCTLGILPHITASILGLAAVLHTSAAAFQAVKLAGVAYLLYLAWSMWHDNTSNPANTTQLSAQSYVRIILKGFALNILNPKLSIFFLAFLPQFVSLQAIEPVHEMMLLSTTFMAMTLVVFVVYGLLAGSVRHHILDQPRIMLWVRRTFAGAFASLGLKLAMTER